MVRRIYMAAGLILGLIVGASLPAAAQSSRIFYIDYSSGSNSNPGTKTSPWKTHPYMQTGAACTGTGYAPTYTHQAGDHFIFKGGVTWPAACFEMDITSGGTSGAQDYYGVDKTWYTGSSWTRPIWDMNYTAPTGNYVVFAGAGTGYETFDNIEIEHQNIPLGTLSYPQGCGMQFAHYSGTGKGVVVENMYIHDWMSTNNMTSASTWPCMGSVQGAAVLENSVISDANGYAYLNGAKTNEPWGGGCINCGEVKDNVFRDGWEGCFSVGSCHDNEFYGIEQNNLANADGAHTQVIEDDVPCASPGASGGDLVYNNYIHDNHAGVNIFVKTNSYVFNNVLANNTNNFGINLCLPGSGYNTSSAVGYIFDNTVECSATNACIGEGSNQGVYNGTLYVENNVLIGGTNNTCFNRTGCLSVATLNMDHNYSTPVGMGSSEATTYGFVSLTKYRPYSSDPNVSGRGVNLASFCSGNLAALCRDASGAPWIGGSYINRPAGGTAWDLGAYQFTAQLSSQPVPPSSLTASVQ